MMFSRDHTQLVHLNEWIRWLFIASCLKGTSVGSMPKASEVATVIVYTHILHSPSVFPFLTMIIDGFLAVWN